VWDEALNIAPGMKAVHKGMELVKAGREKGSLRVLHMRHKHSTLTEALFKTAFAGDLQYVRMLIEDRHLDVNANDKVGW